MCQEILAKLKDTLKGRPVIVISAGPSAFKWKDMYDSIKDQNPFVVCIKQAIELEGASDICDVHFINPYNLKKYSYKKKPLIIFSDALDAPRVFNKYDVHMVVSKDKNVGLEETLAYKHNFDDFLIEKSGTNRPWGPGIIYESVFYSLLFMGAKKIITVGWDIADSSGGNKHFYDNKSAFKVIDEGVRKVFYKLRIGFIYNYVSYLLGRKYNFAGMLEGEAEITSKSIPYLKNWLASKSVELEIVSDSKWMK